MTLHIRDAGVWKEVTEPSVRDGGVWKAIQEGWVRDAGVWKQFYAAGPAIALTNETVSVMGTSGSVHTASYRLTDLGRAERNANAAWTRIAGEWTPEDPIDGSLYEVRRASGDLNGFGTGEWLSLGTTRTSTASRSTAGITSTSGVIEIRPVDGAVVASATITLSVELEAPL